MRGAVVPLSITLAIAAVHPALAQRVRGIPIPAASDCARIGGTSVTRYDSGSAPVSYCRLRDGREVDERTLGRQPGQHGQPRRGDRRIGMADPAARYCMRVGGRYDVASAADAPRTAWCRTRDGRTWDAWRLYRLRGDDRDADGYDDRDDRDADGGYGAMPADGRGYDGYVPPYARGGADGNAQPYPEGSWHEPQRRSRAAPRRNPVEPHYGPGGPGWVEDPR